MPQSSNDRMLNSFESSPEAAATAAPKPKKFFKSRNSVPDTEQAQAIESQIAASTPGPAINDPTSMTPTSVEAERPATEKLSMKINKRQLKKTEGQPKKPKAMKATKVEKEPPVEKSPKVKKKNSKVENVDQVKPTRVLSRARKTVDYAERNSRSPSPKSRAALAVQPTEIASPNHVEMSREIDSSPSKNSNTEHPPIVLRISKVSANDFR